MSAEDRRQIQAITKELRRTVEGVVKGITFELTAELPEATPVASGWAKRNWIPSTTLPVERTFGSERDPAPAEAALAVGLGRIVADELTRKLETEIRFDWVGLGAADIASRARGFQSLVNGGMDVAKAAALAGILAPEEGEA